MNLLNGLYHALIGLGLVVLMCTALAIRRSRDRQESGRLWSLFGIVAGAVLAGAGRIHGTYPLIVAGVAVFDLGLVGAIAYIPERATWRRLGKHTRRAIRSRSARRRRRESGGVA